MAIDALGSQVQNLEGVTTTSSTGSTQDRLQTKALGQDEFFKLLTTQLASQDPLEPMEDTAFIAQMANFSQLEMTSQMTKSFDKFTDAQSFTAAQGFIGKVVSLSSGEIGEVTSVERQDGTTMVFLDGNEYEGHDIASVYRVDANPNITSSRQAASESGTQDDG